MAFINAWPQDFETLNCSVPKEPYRYWNLQRNGWFRLLVIVPSVDREAAIYCSLLHRPLMPDVKYDALSYTWDDEKGRDVRAEPVSYTWDGNVFAHRVIWPETETHIRYKISIDGGLFLVRRNLYCAIKALRREHEPRDIWIDAICINQADIAERGFQVAQMSSIYAMAETVIVWLGEGNERTDSGMTGLFHLAYKCGEHRDRETLLQALQADLALLLGQSDWETVLTGILLLYTRIWWTRVWTAQEIVLAREAEVYCGDKHLPWTVFTYLAKILEIPQMAEVLSRHPSSSDTARQLKQLMPTFHYRTGTIDALREHKKKGDISLWYTMRLVSDRKCTDPRDKIYGVLGLLDGHLPMQPDYSLSATQVVIAASTAMLKETGDLRLFGLISDEQGWRDESLPSWVPDFISWSNHGRVFKPIGRAFGDKRAFSACPPVESGPQFAFRFEQADTLLHLSGIGFDQIDSVGEGAPDILDPRSKDPQASHKDTIMGWKALALASDLSYPTGEPLPAAFWRTVLIDRRVNDYHSSFSSSRAFGKSRLDRDDPIIPPADAELEARLIRGLDSPNEGAASHLCYRRFAVLRNGYFGLVPSTAQQGDLVVVLLGGEVPYLLRPAANGRHKVLGECYVHGIMDGEVIKKTKEGVFVYSTFILE